MHITKDGIGAVTTPSLSERPPQELLGRLNPVTNPLTIWKQEARDFTF